MKTDLEKINSVQHRLTVSVPANDVNQGFDNAYANIKKKVQIQGFRKGHAPLGMIKKLYQEHVQAEVSENLVRTFLPQALQKGLEDRKDIKPAGYPVVEEIHKANYGEDFSFSAVIDVLPEVEVKDYKGMSLTCFKQDTVDDGVEKELERIQKSQAKSKSVDEGTVAAEGHLVTVAFAGTDKESGEKVPAETSDKSMGTLGQGELPDYIDTAVRGKAAGASFTVEHTFDKEHVADALKGKTLNYEVKLEQIQTVDYPKLDDDLAKDLGLESLEDLKGKIKENLEATLERNRRSQLEESALNQLLEKNDVEVPPSIVDQLINDMMSEFPFQNKADRDKAMRNQDFRNRLQPSARRRAQNTFVLWQVAQNEGLEVSDDDIKAEIKNQYAQSGKEPDAKELEETFNRIGTGLKENMTVKKAMDYIIEHAKIEEKDAPAPDQHHAHDGHVHDENCNH